MADLLDDRRHLGPGTVETVIRRTRLLALATLCSLTACSGGSAPARTTAPSTPSSSASPSASATRGPATAALTGLPAGSGSGRRVLGVKVDNIAAALPQAGLDAADVVVEEPVEGGLTRLMAVFQSRDTGRVGPVRSARVSDAELVRIFGGGGLAFSGASSSQLPVLRRAAGVTLLPPGGSAWRRDGHRSAPHNLYVDERALLAGSASRLPAAGPGPPFSFSPGPVGGGPARTVELRWPAASASWSWDGTGWQRSQGGRADRLENGQRLGAANVLVLQVRTTSEARFHDKNGQRTPLLDLASGGLAWLLRDGRAVPGSWQRPADGSFRLVDGHGAVLALRPGTSWVELLPAPGRPVIG